MISFLDDNFTSLNSYIQEKNPSKLFFLVDENTHENCLPIVLANLSSSIPFEIIEIESGEENKNIQTVTQLWEILAEFQADRKALFINIGGGVITDLGGFVASTYKRGIPFINIPTTLLSMVDASIGGKTGIDLLYLKNIVGTFSNAEKILVYPKFLKTLPFVELRSGFAEMLKHGLIADKNHWNQLSNLSEISSENLENHLETSMKIKQNVVEKDFKEQNLRKTLNFGHTIGHALESLFLEKNNRILHGEAIAIGMICENYLSFSENLISKELMDKINTKILHYFPYISINELENDTILALMTNDKKNEHGKINFSILNEVGSCLYDVKIDSKSIENAINYYKNLNK